MDGGSPLFLTELLRHPARAGTGGRSPCRTRCRRRWPRGSPTPARTRRSCSRWARCSAWRSRLDDVAVLAGLDVEDCARRARRAIRAGLLVAHGGTASGSPTTSCARWPTTSVPGRGAGQPAPAGGPAAGGAPGGGGRAPRRGRRPGRRGAAWHGGRACRPAQLRPHRGRAAARPGGRQPRGAAGCAAARRCCAAGRCAPSSAGTRRPARDHEARRRAGPRARGRRAGGTGAGAARLDRAVRPRRTARRWSWPSGPPSWPSRRRPRPGRAERDAAAGPGAALGRRLRRGRRGLRAGARPRRAAPATARSRSRWPTAARCCSTRTGSPRPRRCWRGRRRCAGAPASSGRCCRPCSSPRWPAATPATSAAPCRRWTPPAG